MKVRHKVVPSIYLLPIRDGKIVLLKRQNTGYEDGNYGLIAGHAEENESVVAAMVREAREEAGIEINPANLELVHVMHRRQEDERIDFFFVCKNWKGEIVNNEPDKCSEILLADPHALPQNTIPYIIKAINQIFIDKKNYSEWGY